MEIEDLINSVVDQDFSKAAPTFAEIMRTKMDDALEQEKISVADQIFNGHEADEEESMEDDDDITDEEIDDAISELDDEEEALEDDAEEVESDLEEV
jgi:C-terminal processing protease CtpA/Prc